MRDLTRTNNPIQRAEWARENLREGSRNLRTALKALKDVLSEDVIAELEVAMNNAEEQTDRFGEQQATRAVEHVDYEEAAAVREIEREMAIEAGDDSEIDRQVAEDDARFERAMWLANQAAKDGAVEAYVDAYAEVADVERYALREGFAHADADPESDEEDVAVPGDRVRVNDSSSIHNGEDGTLIAVGPVVYEVLLDKYRESGSGGVMFFEPEALLWLKPDAERVASDAKSEA